MGKRVVAIFGGGPAGLMAAERLGELGHSVTLYEQMPTVGRKLLLAGKSGLNLTHSEPFENFVSRYGKSAPHLRNSLREFSATELRAWADQLGAETFVGSSGRVFPKVMKASPLLRAWKARLESLGVKILTRHRWAGFDEDMPLVETAEGVTAIQCDAALFAFGGASWPRLGSDAHWVDAFRQKGIEIAPFRSSNCGFDVAWSEHFSGRFVGEPVKSVALTSELGTSQGEFVITKTGIEGGLIYAHSACLRDQLDQHGKAELVLDLAPGRTKSQLITAFAKQDQKLSFSNFLRKGAGLTGIKAALIAEFYRGKDVERLASLIKELRIPLLRPRPIEEAISSAGGICWSQINGNYMLCQLPGMFVAGEMIDWEAPTGGYLLTACFATGRAAAEGIHQWLEAKQGKV